MCHTCEMVRSYFVRARLNEDEYNFVQRVRERTGAKTSSEALRFCVNLAKILYDSITIPRPEVYAKALKMLGNHDQGKY